MLQAFLNSSLLEAGCDEAGRGCLAGPVFAAAVILDKEHRINGLNDSKKLSSVKREKLRVQIEESALAWSVASSPVQLIDEINILQASVSAMHKAIDRLRKQPQYLLIDGNYFKPYKEIAYSTVIQGDGIYEAIAAASILAKTHRDEFMRSLSMEFPEYGFEKHKGYATPQHIEAIKKLGYSKAHRKSFNLKQLQLRIF